MATDRLFNQSQGEELLSILEQIRDGYNSVDSLFSKTSVNPIQNKVLTNAITDTIEILGGTAQKSYSIGQYFLANDGYYYVATAAITAGSSNISTGASGNCSKTTIAAGMNNLTSQISNLIIIEDKSVNTDGNGLTTIGTNAGRYPLAAYTRENNTYDLVILGRYNVDNVYSYYIKILSGGSMTPKSSVTGYKVRIVWAIVS